MWPRIFLRYTAIESWLPTHTLTQHIYCIHSSVFSMLCNLSLGTVCEVLDHVWPPALRNENICYHQVNVFTRMCLRAHTGLHDNNLYCPYMKRTQFIIGFLLKVFRVYTDSPYMISKWWLEHLKWICHKTENFCTSLSPQRSHAEHTAPQGPVLHWLSAEGTFQLLCPGWRPGSCGYP